MLNWIKVKSSVLSGVCYIDNTLYLQFNNERIYLYYNVPSSVYDHLCQAPSLGKYFNQYIKDKYEYKRLN